MAKMPPAAPPKPAGQGGKAAANVQQPMVGVPSVDNTANLPHKYDASANNWQQHMITKQPGGTRGTNKGAR